jgi:sortase A
MATGELTRRRFPALPAWGRGAPSSGAPGAAPAAVRLELTPALAVLRWVLVAVSGLAVWLVLFAFVLSPLQEHRAQHTLYAQFRQELAAPNAPVGIDPNTGAAIRVGAPVAILSAPAIGLSQVVVEGTDAAQTRSGPGHVRNTALPGQAGIAKIFGRSVLYGAPFAAIPRLERADEIHVVTGQGRFMYQVLAVLHEHDKLPPFPASQGELWLQTSESHGWRRGWAPSDTVTVVAALVRPNTATPPPVGPKGQSLTQLPLSGSEKAMSGDTSGLFATMVWLQGLLLAALGLVWAIRGWGALQALTVGVVVLVALLWGATNSAALLLPNLF